MVFKGFGFFQSIFFQSNLHLPFKMFIFFKISKNYIYFFVYVFPSHLMWRFKSSVIRTSNFVNLTKKHKKIYCILSFFKCTFCLVNNPIYKLDWNQWVSKAFGKTIKELIHLNVYNVKNWLSMQSHKFQTPHSAEAVLCSKQLDSGEGRNSIVGCGVL